MVVTEQSVQTYGWGRPLNEVETAVTAGNSELQEIVKTKEGATMVNMSTIY